MVWFLIALLALFNVVLRLWRVWVTRKRPADYEPY